VQQKLLHQATPGIGSTAEPLMKTKWEYLCENITKEGDIIDKYDHYHACPLCSTDSTEVDNPSYEYGDQPQLEDVDVDYDMWTLGCPDCGFEITYERTTVAIKVKIPEQIPEHLVGLPADYCSDEHEEQQTEEQTVEQTEKGDPPKDDEFETSDGWRFSRKTGWEYPR